MSTKSNQDSRVVRRTVAAVRSNPPPNRRTFRWNDLNSRPQHVSIHALSYELETNPVLLVARLVDQQSDPCVVVNQQDIGVAVVVHVSEGHPTADFLHLEGLAPLARNIFKCAVASVVIELVSLIQRVGITRSYAVCQNSYGTRGDCDIQPTVVVVIEPARSERRNRKAGGPQFHFECMVIEEAFAVVDVEGVGFLHEMGHEQIFVSVSIEVSRIYAHTGLSPAHPVHRDSCKKSVVQETTVALVDPHLVGHTVVCHVDIHPSVAVEVCCDDSEPGSVLS